MDLCGRGFTLQGLQGILPGGECFQVIDLIVIDPIVIFLLGAATPASDPFKEMIA